MRSKFQSDLQPTKPKRFNLFDLGLDLQSIFITLEWLLNVPGYSSSGSGRYWFTIVKLLLGCFIYTVGKRPTKDIPAAANCVRSEVHHQPKAKRTRAFYFHLFGRWYTYGSLRAPFFDDRLTDRGEVGSTLIRLPRSKIGHSIPLWVKSIRNTKDSRKTNIIKI